MFEFRPARNMIRSLIYESAQWTFHTSEIHRRDVVKLLTRLPEADESQEVHRSCKPSMISKCLSPKRFMGLNPNESFLELP